MGRFADDQSRRDDEELRAMSARGRSKLAQSKVKEAPWSEDPRRSTPNIVWPTPSGNAPGDQWLSAARRENDSLLSGLRFEPTLPPMNAISSTSVFNRLAAIRRNRSAMRSAC